MPATGDASWGITANADFTLLDAQTPLGALGCQPTTQPSTSLYVKVAAGQFVNSTGAIVSFAGFASLLLTASATNYLYLTDAGAIVVDTTGFPASTFHVRIASVVTSASAVTSVTDARVALGSGGNNLNTVYLALASGGTVAASMTIGGELAISNGTNTPLVIDPVANKVGFFGTPPVVKQTWTTLTDSTGGVATSTLTDVGASFSQTTLNADFATVAAKINLLYSILHAYGMV